MILRTISFLLVLLSALFLPFWFFVIAVLTYGFVYQPYEILLIAVMIDAQFGDVGGTLSYSYTAAVILVALVFMFLKPQLRIVKQT